MKAEEDSERIWNEVGWYSLYNSALAAGYFGATIESVFNAPFEDLVFYTTINNVTK